MSYDRCVYIHRVPVYLRQLRFGDLVVWHPFNERVREIVEPICRGRGYWRPDYSNWLVFRRFATQVQAELESHGE